MAVNPKQYFEFFSDDSVNKKHKGIKKGSGGMEYSNNANRITSLVNFNRFEKPRSEYKEVERFVVKQGDMVKIMVTKTKFSQLNDKRFYFPNSILSLPYGHLSLEALDNFKKEQGSKDRRILLGKKDELLVMEKEALQSTPRLELFNQILNQVPKIVNLNEKSDFETFYKPKVRKNIKDIVLSGEWMK